MEKHGYSAKIEGLSGTFIPNASPLPPPPPPSSSPPAAPRTGWQACSSAADRVTCCAEAFHDKGHTVANVNFRTASFKMAVFPTGDIVSQAIKNSGVWEATETGSVLEQLQNAKANAKNKGATLLDIGANIGFITL